MVKVKEDLTGRKFGKWTVIQQAEDYIDPKGVRHAKWLCECSCEDHTRRNVSDGHLKGGRSTSCGCSRRKYNTYDDEIYCDEYGEYRVGYCSNNNHEFYFDAADFDLIKQYHWIEHIHAGEQYSRLEAFNSHSKKMVSFTSVIGCRNYDHADRNALNNRRYNLRPASVVENNQNRSIPKSNTSGIIGVSLFKRDMKWRAVIYVNSDRISLGSFKNKEDAICARLRGEKEYYGEFAPQRHLFTTYGIE